MPDLLTRLKTARDGPGITRAQIFSLLTRSIWLLLSRQSLGVTKADTLKMRGKRPFVSSNVKRGEGVEPIANFIIETGGLAKNAA